MSGAWVVRIPTPPMQYGAAVHDHVYLWSCKMVRQMEELLPAIDLACCVFSNEAVEYPFNQLEDAVAAAFRLGGTVEEWRST